MRDISHIVKDKLTVVIISYNSNKPLKKLIKSLNYIKNITNEIIVIDNNSSEPINIPKGKIKLINNPINYGFAKAVNLGIKLARSKYILLLNPDTELTDSSIENLLETIASNKKIGIIGGSMITQDQEKFFSANTMPNFLTGLFEFTNIKKLFPNNHFSKKFWIEKSTKIIKPIEVDAICGGFMLFRKYINKKIQLFDENFFLYMEDLDFCINVKKQNKKIIFNPNSIIKHIGGYSSNSKYRIVLKHWYKSRAYFFKKHYPISGRFLKLIFIIEESLLRLYHFIKNEPNE